MYKFTKVPYAAHKQPKRGKIVILALFLPGAFAPVISGSIGATTFSHNSSGPYIKNKVIPINPATSFQVTARNAMAYFAAQWRTLTAVQELAWNAFAVLNPVVNRIGLTITLSGFNMYCRLNINLFNAGQPGILVPPVASAFTVLSPLTLLPTCIAGAISINFTVSPIPSGTAYFIFGTPPLSTGKTFVKSQLRLFHVSLAAVVTPIVVTTFYTARFGAPPAVAGAKLFFEIQAVNTANGYTGIPLKASCLSS